MFVFLSVHEVRKWRSDCTIGNELYYLHEFEFSLAFFYLGLGLVNLNTYLKDLF